MVEQAIKQFIEQTKGQVQPAVLLPMGWRGISIPTTAFALRTELVAMPVVTSLDAARALIYGSVHVKIQDGVQVAPLGDDDDE